MKKSKYSYLYDYETNKYGNKVFTKKPSTFSDAEIQRAVKLINDRIYNLEKRGMQMESRFYRNIMKYAEKDTNLFNVSDDGRIRVTSNLARISGDSTDQKYTNIKHIQGYLSSQTSTISGTNKAIQKAYETFIKNPAVEKMAKKIPTLQEYKNLWKTYQDSVAQDKKDLLGSDVVIQALRKLNFYDLPQADLERAFRYTEQIDSIESVTGMKELFNLWKEGKLITGAI